MSHWIIQLILNDYFKSLWSQRIFEALLESSLCVTLGFFPFSLVYQETPVRTGTGCVSAIICQISGSGHASSWESFFLIWGKPHDPALWGTRGFSSRNGEHETVPLLLWLLVISSVSCDRRGSEAFSGLGLCKPSVWGYFGCLRNLCVLNEGTNPK